ncbi:glycosyltransferase [Aestuariivivens insulae]|uniref:glycosyltransferase n=1 Tax=Aestuariivivens insulae TaxID=1621988 RepID=UPI001F5A2FFE|nr:glycosyltransferase [Aestuariivivens insulae]
MYHKVYLESPTMWWVTVNNFYRQMVEISGKDVVYLDDYDASNENQVVITFDGIYENVLQYAAPILSNFGFPFELFLTSEYIGKDNTFDAVEPLANFVTKDQLAELVKLGGRLQWHTKTHINLKEITDIEIIKDELKIPKDIRDLDKKGFKWFAYPHGEYNQLVLEEVKKQFKGALSCHQGSDDNLYKLNRLTVVNDTKLRKAKIACIIASYNYGDYLIDAVESVLKQTILPDEILITDDCSQDETQIIGESYAKRFPKLIRYNRNEVNLGVVAHFNKAISLTNSEYICFLGADNRMFSNYIEKTSQVLDSNDKVGIAYTDYAFFGNKAKRAYLNMDEKLRASIIDNIYYQISFPVFESIENLKDRLVIGNIIHGSSMFKRKAFDGVGGYLKSEIPEDYNLFKRIVDANWMALKADTNLEYRQHSSAQLNDLTTLNNKLLFYKSEYEKILNEKNRLEHLKIVKTYNKLKWWMFFLRNNYKNPLIIVKKLSAKLIKNR